MKVEVKFCATYHLQQQLFNKTANINEIISRNTAMTTK